jgi:hypothetical protein
MQNREELRQKGHERSQKMTYRERGENHFQRGRGNKYCFGPKYRPLIKKLYQVTTFAEDKAYCTAA